MDWNYDISQAPQDRPVILAAGDGTTVTKSYWIEKEHRWMAFSKSAQPLAWMLWPDHPEAPHHDQ